MVILSGEKSVQYYRRLLRMKKLPQLLDQKVTQNFEMTFSQCNATEFDCISAWHSVTGRDVFVKEVLVQKGNFTWGKNGTHVYFLCNKLSNERMVFSPC